MENENKFIAELLYKRFGSLLLSKSECSLAVGKSACTLDRERQRCIGIPFIKESPTANVYYSITDIAQYIVDKKIQTTSVSIYSN